MELYNLVSLSGILLIMVIAWLFSSQKKNINWRVIVWGLIFQSVFALFIFIIPVGAKIFLFVNDLVVKVMDTASDGVRFVFGDLANSNKVGFILAFQALPTIIFFSSLMSVLYFINILPKIIKGFANLFTKFMKISGAESLSVSCNIFFGVESFLVIKPHLEKMTKSELCTVLTAGMATVASNVLVLYISTLYNYFPTIAGHLISASFLSAPASVIISKIILPEDGKPATLGQNIDIYYEKESSLTEAIINGANSGVKLIVGIAALLIAILGFVAIADLMLGSIGKGINYLFQTNITLSLKSILGYIFYPLTLIIGVPFKDAFHISQLIGERAVITEVGAYMDLSELLKNNSLIFERSKILAAYSLCGFAHIASLSIFIGGAAALAPNKIKELSSIGFRAFLSATLACLLTAAIAGTFFMKNSILLGK